MTELTWREGAPDEFHEDIVAVGTSPNMLALLKCSPGVMPELCVAEFRDGRLGRLLRTGDKADHSALEALLPREQWPYGAAPQCGAKLDPIPKRLGRKHERTLRPRRPR